MPEIICFGDIHLSDDRPWMNKVGKAVVDYICTLPENNSDNVGLFLGDITERTSISGNVFNTILGLAHVLKFKKTYILIGNHDIKFRNGGWTTPLLFLKDDNKQLFKNIEIISEPYFFMQCGVSILALPFKPQFGASSIKDYEKINQGTEDLKNPTVIDLIVGHFADTSDPSVLDTLVNITHIKSKYRCLGHIHKPSGNYIGSMIPNKVSEGRVPRYIHAYGKDTFRKIELPIFCDYYEVTYPEELPSTPALYPLWTVKNCKDKDSAVNKYPDSFIYKCLFDITMDLDSFRQLSGGNNIEKLSSKELVKQYLDSVGDSIPKKIKEITLSYL
jgi:hypothetical protein